MHWFVILLFILIATLSGLKNNNPGNKHPKKDIGQQVDKPKKPVDPIPHDTLGDFD